MNEYHGVIVVGIYQTLHEKYGSINKLESKTIGRTWKGKRWKSYTVIAVVTTSNFYFVN